MAASSSKPPMSLKSQGETWLSRGPISHQFFNYGTRVATRRISCGCVSRLQRFLVRGCWCDQASSLDDYGVTEEDKEFVKVLSEAQPYIAVHSDRVFVVVISAEIVASPYWDPILKNGRHKGLGILAVPFVSNSTLTFLKDKRYFFRFKITVRKKKKHAY